MVGNLRLNDFAQIVSAIVPVDLATASNPGDYVTLKDYHRCAVVVQAAAGTAANDITVTMQQATDVSGTGAKALDFTRVDVKQGADVQAIAQFTEVTQAAGNTYTSDTNGEEELIYVFEFLAEDLDIDNDFDCLNVTVSQAGAAKVGSAHYVLFEPKNATSPQVGAIAD